MWRVVAQRVAVALPTLLLVLVLTFLLIELMPGDPATILAGDSATPEVIAEIRHDLGLDRGLSVRFWDYLTGVASTDLGRSLFTSRPVMATIVDGLAVTGSIALVSLTLSVLVSLVLGCVAGLHPGSMVDRLVTTFATIALSLPSFVWALLLVIPLALQRSWLPATGYTPLGEGVLPWLEHLILPALALSANSIAELTRQIRAAVLEVMEQDYIRTGLACGLRRLTVVRKHMAKNAAPPVVTVLGLQVGRVLGSAVIVESVFAMPGFGSVAYQAVLRQDIPLIQGLVLCSAVLVLVANLLVDISYGYFSPVTRTG